MARYGSLRRELLVIGLLTPPVVSAAWVFHAVGTTASSMNAHRRWGMELLEDFRSMRQNKYAEVNRDQWDFAVDCTLNLHANSTFENTKDYHWMGRFSSELKQRLTRSLTIADIDWIWDEFAANTKYGQEYSDRYRPTRLEGFRKAQAK